MPYQGFAVCLSSECEALGKDFLAGYGGSGEGAGRENLISGETSQELTGGSEVTQTFSVPSSPLCLSLTCPLSELYFFFLPKRNACTTSSWERSLCSARFSPAQTDLITSTSLSRALFLVSSMCLSTRADNPLLCGLVSRTKLYCDLPESRGHA